MVGLQICVMVPVGGSQFPASDVCEAHRLLRRRLSRGFLSSVQSS